MLIVKESEEIKKIPYDQSYSEPNVMERINFFRWL